MIENPVQVGRLIPKLRAALPLMVSLSPGLAAVVRARLSERDVPQECRVTEIHYAGDEGGIMCKLAVADDCEQVFYVSMTHLTFRRRHPLAREIAAYQKHRIKRLCTLNGVSSSRGAPQLVSYTFASDRGSDNP